MIRNRMTVWSLGVVAAAGALFTSAVEAEQPPPPVAQWVKYEILPSMTGPDGKTYSATCSGLPGTDPALFDGIFKADDPANPVHDWNFVYIPYCTGDVHSGSATRQYTSVGHPVLPHSPGTPLTIQHRGFDNFMVVLDWIRQNFDAPKNILVTGPSAGGYGASTNFPWVADAYPNAHVFVVADASQGVTTTAFDSGNPGRKSWNPQLPSGVDANTPGPNTLRAMAERHPRAKVSQFTTASTPCRSGSTA